MSRLSALSFIVAYTLFFTVITVAQDRSISVEQWREDLTFLKDKLEEMHPHAWFRTPKDQWMESWREVYYQAPLLTDDQIKTAVVKLVADLGDGHSRVRMASVGFNTYYPVRTYMFSDGVFIVAASARYQDLVGSRVVRYGTMPVEKAYELASGYASWDNKFTRIHRAPRVLMYPALVYAMGLSKAPNEVELEIVTPDGRTRMVDIIDDGLSRWSEGQEGLSSDWFDFSFGLPHGTARMANDGTAELPLALKDQSNSFFYVYLERSNTLYVQFNAVRNVNSQGEILADFVRRLFTEADKNKVEKLIFDVRWNPGGNNALLVPLITGIIRHDRLNQHSRLFLITGRQTFSAAMSFTGRMEYYTNVTIAGEPSGSAPNQYGDSRDTTLPHSRITIAISSVWWMNTSGTDRREFISPRIPVQWSFDDFRNRRDPVLDKLLKLDDFKLVSQQMKDALDAGGIDAMRAAFLSYKKQFPDMWGADSTNELNTFGYQLLRSGDLEATIAVFELNVETYPDYANGWDSLGEAWMNKGDFEKAIRFYQKSLELNPANSNAEQMIERMKKQESRKQ